MITNQLLIPFEQTHYSAYTNWLISNASKYSHTNVNPSLIIGENYHRGKISNLKTYSTKKKNYN